MPSAVVSIRRELIYVHEESLQISIFWREVCQGRIKLKTLTGKFEN